MEKEYECVYCKNRFKNQNEAKRHTNSLHLRKHSWSCAAMKAASDEFHHSTCQLSLFDICGYCGEQFPNIEVDDWTDRIEHLQAVHKFKECNLAKRFFRLDHFRQHLKHSHAASTGKWTNALENACMKDEPLPEPMPPTN
jgi:hypothetical protein